MAFLNKNARTQLAKKIINETIPALLRADDRAGKSGTLYHGDDLAHLPQPSNNAPTVAVSLIQSDTFEAAQMLHTKDPKSKVAVLNMASPMQPGGGVLRGAKAQEEALCMRSTLYPTLNRQWYRLPNDAVIYSPDVLVFNVNGDLAPTERFYIDVISCAAVRMPDLKDENGKEVYAEPKDEEMMALKIKYIMRMAAKMGVKKLVLGAIGCGAYRNPIHVVAKSMRRCLLGKDDKHGPQEDWRVAGGVEEVVIAIYDETPQKKVWNGFRQEFEGVRGVQIVTK